MILNAFPSGGGSGFANFSYTGKIKLVSIDNMQFLFLLTSGTLSLYRNIQADIFALGGGGAGGSNSPGDSSTAHSGGGGAGGFYTEEYNQILTARDYDVTIGDGAYYSHASGTTSIKVTGANDYLYTASGGNNARGSTGGNGSGTGGTGSGGSGGVIQNGVPIQSPTSGETGMYPFGVESLGLFGGGGNGGGMNSQSPGTNADDNTGKGGGGRGRYYSTGNTLGSGGSGIVIMRIGGNYAES